MTEAVITIEPAQRNRIKKSVAQARERPVTADDCVTVGSVLPAQIELARVPPTWGRQFCRYRYVESAGDVA